MKMGFLWVKQAFIRDQWCNLIIFPIFQPVSPVHFRSTYSLQVVLMWSDTTDLKCFFSEQQTQEGLDQKSTDGRPRSATKRRQLIRGENSSRIFIGNLSHRTNNFFISKGNFVVLIWYIWRKLLAPLRLLLCVRSLNRAKLRLGGLFRWSSKIGELSS